MHFLGVRVSASFVVSHLVWFAFHLTGTRGAVYIQKTLLDTIPVSRDERYVRYPCIKRDDHVWFFLPIHTVLQVMGST